MKVTVNGADSDIAPGTTINDVIVRKGLTPEIIVIEYNCEIVRRERWDEIILQQGDRLEIIAFVGGG